MTKKDYELIARIVASISDDAADTRWTVGDAFCVALKQENPRFDMVKFQKACHMRMKELPR